MCLYSQIILNRKYTKNKKNGGVIPTIPDRRVEYVPTKCGRCIECRKQLARDWKIRLTEDIKTHKTAKMITLTFSNQSIAEICDKFIRKTIKENGQKEIRNIRIGNMHGYLKDNTIAIKATRLFLERYRDKHKKSLRHWLITELGHRGTENIHLHGLVWLPTLDKWEEQLHDITKLWKYGWTYIGQRKNEILRNYVSEQTVNYMVKYVHKTDQLHKEYKPKILCSDEIGANYMNTLAAKKNSDEQTEYYKTSQGYKLALPTYYRKKIFTETELERLWIKKLDTETRYVMGAKISIANGEEEFKEAVQQARVLNQQLGYGNLPNENRKAQEELRRELKIKKRITDANGYPAEWDT